MAVMRPRTLRTQDAKALRAYPALRSFHAPQRERVAQPMPPRPGAAAPRRRRPMLSDAAELVAAGTISAKLCSACGRRHARGHCALAPTGYGTVAHPDIHERLQKAWAERSAV